MSARDSDSRNVVSGPSRLSAGRIDLLQPRLARFKLVFMALVAGVILFGAVILATGGPLELELPPSTISTVLLGVGLVTGLQGILLPGLLRRMSVKNLARDADLQDERLADIWFSSSLIGAALLESAAFLNLIGLLLEHNPVHLLFAGMFAVLMLMHYPGTNRILDWMDRALRAE